MDPFGISNEGECINPQIGNTLTRHCYDIPELQNATVYLSSHSWLLLSSVRVSSLASPKLFFFNPLSRVRIDLPHLLISNSLCIFTITAPPTAKDCIVFVTYIKRKKFREQQQSDQSDVIWVSLCRHGKSNWITKEYTIPDKILRFTSAVFYGGLVYCYHINGHISVFDISNYKWKVINKRTPPFNESPMCVIERNERLVWCFDNNSRCLVTLENFHKGKVVVKESDLPGNEEDKVFSEEEDIALHPNGVQLDTFNFHLWDSRKDSMNHLSFRWNSNKQRDNPESPSVWIQPRWVPSSPSLLWTTR